MSTVIFLELGWLYALCELKMLHATSVNKWCCSHQPLQPPPLHHSKPQGNSGQKHNPPQWIIRHCSHSLNEATWGDSVWENRILAPNSWGAYQNKDLSEPRLLHLLIHRKALNSLRYLAFFKSNLLMLQLPGLPCKISYVFWSLPIPNPFYNPLCHHSLSDLP